MVKKVTMFLVSLIALLFVVGCSPVVKQAPTSVESVSPTTTPTPDIVSENREPSLTVTLEQGTPAPSYDANISALLELNKKVHSYSYILDGTKGAYFEIFVTQNFTKKVRSDTLKLKGDSYYNTIYLDNRKKTAVAVCDKPGISCSSVRLKAFTVDFSQESDFLTPFDALFNLSYNAHKVGEEIIDGRNTVIVEEVNSDAKKERLWIDYYYGLPLKTVVYESVKGKDVALETHTFTHFIVGVNEEDVILPQEYVIQS